MAWYRCIGGDGGGGSGGVDYVESWIVANTSASNVPTTTTHITYSDGSMTSFDIKSNAGNTTVVMGDLTTFIGDSTSYKWKATVTADMKIRLFDVINQTLGELQTVTSGTVIITGGPISPNPYCIEIRRYE